MPKSSEGLMAYPSICYFDYWKLEKWMQKKKRTYKYYNLQSKSLENWTNFSNKQFPYSKINQFGRSICIEVSRNGPFQSSKQKSEKGCVPWNGLNNNPNLSDDFWQKYNQALEIDGPFLTWLVLGILGYVYISKEPTATYQIQYITKYKQRNINILSKFKKLNSFYFSETRCLYVIFSGMSLWRTKRFY